jgi:hypothetical protein
MAKETPPALPPPPPQLGESQRVAFALAGTIALPSPFPATGLVSIGLFPPPAKVRAWEPTFYLRVVHSLNQSHIITRYVRPEDLRAVRLCSEKQPDSELRGWLFQSAADVSSLIDDKKTTLRKYSDSSGPTEIMLFEQPAIIYVPESAPVLLRLEYGVTAAESLECGGMDGCCTRPENGDGGP